MSSAGPPPIDGVAPSKRMGWVSDSVVAAAVAVALVLNLAVDGVVSDAQPIRLATYAWSVLIAAPLAFRSLAPIVSLAATAAASLLYVALDHPISPALGCVLLALYSVAVSRERRTLVALAGVLPLLALGGLLLGEDERPTAAQWLLGITVPLLVVVVGDAVRSRRALAAAHAEQVRLLQAQMAAESRHQLLEERRRIARELHDVISHAVSSITLHAGVAAHVIDDDPDAARSALVDIRAQGRTALAELGTTLDVLRSESDLPGGGSAELVRQPAPTLERLGALVAESAATATLGRVDLDAVAEVDPAVQLAAYRIVQEALTNAVKHAPGGEVVIDVAAIVDGCLAIEVRNRQPGAATIDGALGGGTSGGFGLVGMHERARAVGGRVDAGLGSDGHFAVSARLPVSLSEVADD